MDGAGNLYIADGGHARVRKVTPAGLISTVAGKGTVGYSGDGGAAISAQLNVPVGVAVDTAGNLYIADGNSQRVRKVTPGGIISTVAGNGTVGYSGDGGPAINAQISPSNVAVDEAGDLYINEGRRIRKVTPQGIINTVAGNGIDGYSGDGGPALKAQLFGNGNLTVDSKGTVYFADSENNAIRLLKPLASPNVPMIFPAGIVPLYSSVNAIQPGEWISIYGTNLASSIATWNGTFTTSLNGTSVTVNGKPAFLSYVSPDQVNVQAPDDTATGSVVVMVSTANGSANGTVTLAAYAPSLSLAADGKHVAGIILRNDGSGAYGGGSYDILGPTGNSFGYATVAAKAGDVLEIFALGFGPTNPSVAAGRPFSGAAPVASPVTVSVNNVKMSPTFIGLSGAGLYQINLTVPQGLGTGDLPMQALAGGVQTQAGVVIPLQ